MSSITIKGTDTVIKQASPDTNFNASSTLEYKSRNSTIASYLYFKVPLELKKDVVINSVTLQIEKFSYEICHQSWTYNSSDQRWTTNLSYSNPNGMSGTYGVLKEQSDLSATLTYNNNTHVSADGNFTAEYWDRFSVSQGNSTDIINIPIKTEYSNGDTFVFDSEYVGLCFLGYFTGSTSYGQDGYWYYGAFKSNTANLIIDYSNKKPRATLTSPLNIALNNAATIEFTWTYEDDREFGQSKYEFGFSYDNVNWTNVIENSSETSYHAPPDKFNAGTVYWRIKVFNTEGFESEYVYGAFTSVLNVPSVTASYPNDVNLNNSSKSIFTWDFTEEVSVGQKTYEIGWSSDGGANWRTASIASDRHYHEYPANTFPVGNIRWRIRATNNFNKISGYSYAEFTAIGQTAAPVIVSVSQDAIPIVTWTSQYQDCFELRIRQGGKIIYESGLTPGSDVRSFRCNVMLADGVYSVEIRMVNTYGYYTEWNTYSYVLGTAKPQAAQVSEVSVQKDFGVKISGVVPAGLKAYVVRKNAKTNETVIVGEYEREFYDYTAPLNQEYFYTIRTYNAAVLGGYTDGAWKRVFIEADGMVLHDAADMKNFIHAHFSEDTLFQVDRTDTYAKTFHNVIGRKYPVKEQMDWMTSQREAAVWLSDGEYERIRDISLTAGNVYYRAEKEAFLCDMEIQLTGRYVGGGKFLKISLNRLDENAEVNLL